MPAPSDPKQQISRTRQNNDLAAFSRKPMLDEHGQQSQMEGPAAYAPHEDEPTSGDEAQKRRKKMQHQQKAEGDR